MSITMGEIVGIKTLAVCLLAGASIVVGTAPVMAAPPWVVTAGSQTVGQAPFSAYTKSPLNFNVAGPGGSVAMSCGAASAAGVIFPGTYATGAGIGRIDGSAWSNCIGPSLVLNIGHIVGNKRPINLTGATGPNWVGYINNVQARVESKPAGVCAFNVTGRINMTFSTAQVAGNNNYTQTMTFQQPNTTPNLLASGVTGCLGLIANNNPIGFNGSFKVYNSIGLIGIS